MHDSTFLQTAITILVFAIYGLIQLSGWINGGPKTNSSNSGCTITINYNIGSIEDCEFKDGHD